MLSLLCAWARHLRRALKRANQSASPCCPLLKLFDKKIYHLNTLHLYPAKTKQRKSYRLLISSCWTIDIRLFDFYRKRGLGPDQSHYQSRRWSLLHTTLAQITRIAPKWIYTVLKFFSQFTLFEQLALALKKKQTFSANFHCSEYTFCIQDF